MSGFLVLVFSIKLSGVYLRVLEKAVEFFTISSAILCGSLESSISLLVSVFLLITLLICISAFIRSGEPVCYRKRNVF